MRQVSVKEIQQRYCEQTIYDTLLPYFLVVGVLPAVWFVWRFIGQIESGWTAFQFILRLIGSAIVGMIGAFFLLWLIVVVLDLRFRREMNRYVIKFRQRKDAHTLLRELLTMQTRYPSNERTIIAWTVNVAEALYLIGRTEEAIQLIAEMPTKSKEIDKWLDEKYENYISDKKENT